MQYQMLSVKTAMQAAASQAHRLGGAKHVSGAVGRGTKHGFAEWVRAGGRAQHALWDSVLLCNWARLLHDRTAGDGAKKCLVPQSLQTKADSTHPSARPTAPVPSPRLGLPQLRNTWRAAEEAWR